MHLEPELTGALYFRSLKMIYLKFKKIEKICSYK
jgi:hypothetical protein